MDAPPPPLAKRQRVGDHTSPSDTPDVNPTIVKKTVCTDTRVLVFDNATIATVQVLEGVVISITQYNLDGNLVVGVGGPGKTRLVVTWIFEGNPEPCETTIEITIVPRPEYTALYDAFQQQFWPLVYRYFQPHFTAWAKIVATAKAIFQHCKVLRDMYAHLYVHPGDDTGSILLWLLYRDHGPIGVANTHTLITPEKVERIAGAMAQLDKCAQRVFADAAIVAKRLHNDDKNKVVMSSPCGCGSIVFDNKLATTFEVEGRPLMLDDYHTITPVSSRPDLQIAITTDNKGNVAFEPRRTTGNGTHDAGHSIGLAFGDTKNQIQEWLWPYTTHGKSKNVLRSARRFRIRMLFQDVKVSTMGHTSVNVKEGHLDPTPLDIQGHICFKGMYGSTKVETAVPFAFRVNPTHRVRLTGSSAAAPRVIDSG